MTPSGFLDDLDLSLTANLRSSGGTAKASWTSEDSDSDSLTLAFSGGLFHEAIFHKDRDGFMLKIYGNFESTEFANFLAQLARHLNASRGLVK